MSLLLATLLLACAGKDAFDPADLDHDGYTPEQGDCDEGDPAVHPGAVEVWYDGIDQDCAGDDDFDQDADGHRAPQGGGADCDDLDPAIHPDATETCATAGVDDDCDGAADEEDAEGCVPHYLDPDGDGWGDASDSRCLCAPDGAYGALETGDCDEGDPAINPGATEVCDDLDVDEDCDGAADDADPEGADGQVVYYPDGDRDNYGDDALGQALCENPDSADDWWTDVGGDCDDNDPAVRPSATEVCNGVDDDCDGAVDATGGGKFPLTCPFAETVDLAVDGDAVLVGAAPGEQAGWPTTTADLDADGTLDVIVAAPAAVGSSGAVRAVSTPVAGTVDLATAPFAWTGQPGEALGTSVAAGGDLTGDGIADLVIGATGAGGGAGGAYVLPGPAAAGSDLSGAIALTGASGDAWGNQVLPVDIGGDGPLDLVVASTTWGGVTLAGGALAVLFGPLAADASLAEPDIRIAGEAFFGGLGQSLARGDVDGDGIDDLAAGALASAGSLTLAGAVHVFLGPLPAGEMSAEDADAIFTGEATGDVAGWSVHIDGDLDGDGQADLATSADISSAGALVGGAVYVVLGGPGLAGGPLGSADAILLGDTDWAYAGSALDVLPDVTADGIDELLVGASGTSSNAGRVMVVYGPFSGTTLLSAADVTIAPAAPGDTLGAWVDASGDLDGDGYHDLLLTALSSDLGGTDAGAVHVLLARP